MKRIAPSLLASLLLASFLLLMSAAARAATCDLDGDGDVDRNDISIILQDRRATVDQSACGADCDIDGDGRITVLDARKCVLQCTLPRCAVVSAPTDSDGDGVPDADDQCPGYDDRIDTDNDGVPDGCDRCAGYDDAADADGDSVPDGCDVCAGSNDLADADNDGVPDGCDVCSGSNDLLDADQDGVPDGCDECPGFDDGIDTDGDTVADGCDVCPGSNDLADADNDGVPDGCDVCAGSDDTADADGDGVPDGCDLCPGENDTSYSDADQDGILDCADDQIGYDIAGLVIGGGTPLPDADVEIGPNSVWTFTGDDGSFSVRVMPSEWVDDGLGGKVFPVEVKADGFGTGYAKVPVVPGQDDYTVQVFMVPVTDGIQDDDTSDGVSDTIEKAGETVGELDIPPGALPDGVTSVTGTVTYLDPTNPDDLAAFPGGDFLAAPIGGGQPVLLESLGLMEFALFDQNGNPITDLLGPATVCMKVPDGLLEEGETSVPLWYYDADAGIWREEGQGTVEDRGQDGLWLCGEVSHFTWWNYDRPVTTHACFKFRMIDEATGEPFTDGRVWYAQGVTYAGSSPERPCPCDSDDPAPCPVGTPGISSFTVKRTTNPDAPEKIRVYTEIGGTRYYLRDDGDGTYSLVTDAVLSTVFDTPTQQGSCLRNQNVENCALLDGDDGVLPVGGYNPPPVITDFTVTPDVLYLGEQADLSVTVTDEDGVQSVSWSASCGSVLPDTSSGNTYPARFTAPDTLPEGQVFEYCTIEVTATDTQGASATARRTVVVHGELPPCEVSGTVYGPDGQPLEGAVVTLQEDYYWGSPIDVLYESTTSTDADGFYAFDDVPCCDPNRGFSFSGTLIVEFEYGGVQWRYGEYVWVPCGGVGTGIQGGILDPIVPAPAGTLAAVVDRLLAGPVAWAFAEVQACGDYDIHLPVLWGTLNVDHTGSGECPPSNNTTLQVEPDPILTDYRGVLWGEVSPFNGSVAIGVPVAPGAVFISCVGGGYDDAAYLLQYRDERRAVAIGDGAVGAVSGTVYDVTGNPVAGAKVVLYRWDIGSFVFFSETTTGTDGNYSFSNVPTGRVMVAYMDGTTEVARTNGLLMADGEILTLDVNGTGATIIGTVYDMYGQPVKGAYISLDNGTCTLTRGDGSFICTGVPTGWNYLFASTDNASVSTDVEVPQHEGTIQLDLVLWDWSLSEGCYGGGW